MDCVRVELEKTPFLPAGRAGKDTLPFSLHELKLNRFDFDQAPRDTLPSARARQEKEKMAKSEDGHPSFQEAHKKKEKRRS
ncbi:hypothetical protein FA10DRAFT_59207 [Acaromyces ingoldii]|uniref:Uncharacterized protein n=1 Tax=Acaromyces ingoldii TaxID=215250 RepID=A0A316YAW5_9BASI|nr:hypothetical protein FA10DRAFT_59207 [Acaromyces ingoldii]PWN86431.1 hypothetical protein FA10DRAFT_59207 [Acaromyces ingoldii]